LGVFSFKEHYPMVTTRKPIEAAELPVAQAASITLDQSEIKRPDLNTSEIEIATMIDTPHADEMKMMEEAVEVLVHESTDQNAAPFVEVWNNGTVQRFIRGTPQVCKRKYLEVLARAKETSVTTHEAIHQHSGDRYTRIDKHTALKYPFSVIVDHNPKGAQWLKGVLASA
jgi:hypothetical protein